MPFTSQATSILPPAEDESSGCYCFHCGLPVPGGLDLSVNVDGRDEPMCCFGCQAVANAIIESGNAAFYRQRTANSITGQELVPDFIKQAQVYDHPEIQKSFVRTGSDNISEAALILEGIVCAACVWLNERHLSGLPGVLDVKINYTTHRALIKWDNTQLKLSEILQAIHRIGYTAHPYDPERQQQHYERERRMQLRRIGIAGVLGMQVMVLSIALYVGDSSGMDAGLKTLFRWTGLLLTTPVLLYSGAPFLQGAWRDLRNRSAGMDVPVSLGILVAFGGSLHAVISGRGDVYFDSVVMFIFFLLVSRFFELVARKRSAERTEQLEQALPTLATRLTETTGEITQDIIPAANLVPGDRVLIKPGETVPADGLIETGQSSINESLLTGESTPVNKSAGEQLIGGSINIESPLQMRVEKTGMDTVLAEIGRLLEQAQHGKPAITRLADRAASWFVSGVLVIAAAVGIYWWQQAPDSWLPILIAVLVVTCPCALSLATPTAISAATGALLSRGLLTASGNGLETLARATHIVFDKTGTLTYGKPAVSNIIICGTLDLQTIKSIAAALEYPSEHPAGKAIARLVKTSPLTATGITNHPGAGISGTIDDTDWFIGNAEFIREQTGIEPGTDTPANSYGSHIFLADDHQLHAIFELEDEIRSSAEAAISAIKKAGLHPVLMSGDNPEATHYVANSVGISDAHANMKPSDKLEQVRKLQQQGAIVVMVGDGINDAPVLAAADVSIAMHDAAHISQASADLTLLSEQLDAIAASLGLARKTLRIIRQNLAWAVSYNLVALPAAAAGFVAPWMAAIGMSASSLLVVLNALRLTRDK